MEESGNGKAFLQASDKHQKANASVNRGSQTAPIEVCLDIPFYLFGLTRFKLNSSLISINIFLSLSTRI